MLPMNMGEHSPASHPLFMVKGLDSTPSPPVVVVVPVYVLVRASTASTAGSARSAI